jgi:hypothetical protein
VYSTFVEEYMAVPVIRGVKPLPNVLRALWIRIA